MQLINLSTILGICGNEQVSSHTISTEGHCCRFLDNGLWPWMFSCCYIRVSEWSKFFFTM